MLKIINTGQRVTLRLIVTITMLFKPTLRRAKSGDGNGVTCKIIEITSINVESIILKIADMDFGMAVVNNNAIDMYH